jgi:large subunit ribosomal protein L24
VKPNPQINEPGGIIEKESFINISNIAFYNSSTKKKDKLEINLDEKKRKDQSF